MIRKYLAMFIVVLVLLPLVTACERDTEIATKDMEITTAQDTGNASESNYEEEMQRWIDKYAKMDRDELLSTMKKAFKEEGANDPLIVLASVFHERRDEFSPDEYLEMIGDNSLDEFLRVTFVQVLNEVSGYDGNDPRLSDLLNSDLPDAIKQSLIAHFGYDGGITREYLEYYAENGVGGVASWAIKSLKKLEATEANDVMKISREILNNITNADAGQIKEAFRTVAENIQNNADEELIYSVADYVLDGNYDSSTKDSIMFALMDMNTYKAMKYLMEQPACDDIMKTGLVDRNYHTLIEMLGNNPTKEQVEFALKCMEIMPIKEVEEPIRKAVSSFEEGTFDMIEVESVLEKIAKNGINGNPAWLEK